MSEGKNEGRKVGSVWESYANIASWFCNGYLMKKQFKIFISSVQDEFAAERKLLKKLLATDPFVSRFVEKSTTEFFEQT